LDFIFIEIDEATRALRLLILARLWQVVIRESRYLLDWLMDTLAYTLVKGRSWMLVGILGWILGWILNWMLVGILDGMLVYILDWMLVYVLDRLLRDVLYWTLDTRA
jgi:hypothetical protein